MWVILLSLFALALRLVVLSWTNFGIESDEAIVGLMAKHIAEGKSWPIFYYGQDYLGSLEAFLTAPFILVFGAQNWVLKLIPLMFSVLFVPLTYFFTAELFKNYSFAKKAGFLAALYVALPPGALLVWGLKARGGFIELLFIGSMALCFFARHGFNKIFYLGLILGVGWWVNNQIIFYLVTLGLIWVMSKSASVKSFFLGLCGFLLGSLPFWYYNLFISSPKFSSLRTLFVRSPPPSEIKLIFDNRFLTYLFGFFQDSLPILLGARKFWSREDLFLGSSITVFVVYGFLFLVILRLQIAKKIRGGLLLLFPAVLALIFSASSFGWLSQAPRYLLPLYSILPVIVGVALLFLPVFLRVVLSVTILVLNFQSIFLPSLNVEGQPFVFKDERVADDHTALYAWLRDTGVSHIFTNYWIGYRVAFETQEKVTFTRYRGPQSLRIPEYEADFKEPEERTYVLVPSEAEEVETAFLELGYSFRKSKVGQYIILDQMSPISGARPKQVRIKEIISNLSLGETGSLVDGSPGTRWASHAPQNPEMFLEARFFKPESVTEIEIDSGFWPQDEARRLRIYGIYKNGITCELFDSIEVDKDSDFQRVFSVYFEPVELIGIRLEQLGRHPIYDWSVAELKIYGE